MPDTTVYVNYIGDFDIDEFSGAKGYPQGEFFRIDCEDGSVVFIPARRIKDVLVSVGRA